MLMVISKQKYKIPCYLAEGEMEARAVVGKGQGRSCEGNSEVFLSLSPFFIRAHGSLQR